MNTGNTTSVTLPVTSMMKVVAGVVVVLSIVSLSYGDPSVDGEDIDKIHGVDEEEDIIEMMDGAPDVSELSRDRRHVGGENDKLSLYLYHTV